MPTTAPYGSWASPISAEDLARAEHPVQGGAFVGDAVWWSEARPEERGRYAVRRLQDEAPVDVLPAPWNARSRVHEYGGGAWTVQDDGVLFFVEYTDQRIYRLDPNAPEPIPLTPQPDAPASERYGELRLEGGELWALRERHGPDRITRDVVAVPTDGSAGSDRAAIRPIVGGSHFLAAATPSPDGRRVAWLAWEHPQMPWDGTELRVADLEDGRAGVHRVLLGSTTESVLAPIWLDDDTLVAATDRDGFWNPYIVSLDGAPRPVLTVEADFGGPLWQVGGTWARRLADGRLLTVRTYGTDTLGVLDLETGKLTDLDVGESATVRLGPARGTELLLVTAGAHTPRGLRRFDLASGQLTEVRSSVDRIPDERFLPRAELRTFPGPQDRPVHAVVYPPRNPDFAAPEDEQPPYVAFVHGGPTAHVQPALSLLTAFFTSRGIGIVDVNYGGSTGYGRAYRERLRGQWGVVDVEDTVAVVLGLADAGLADRDRLAIEGGSAGGWTVLSALTTTDVFACGVSHFGVAELLQFASDTHDFESRYLDSLVGPLPEARALYERRAPVNNVDGLSCPVLLLQGLDDPVVPPSQAERFVAALQRKRLPYAYRAYEGESHGFRKAETIIDAAQAELSFYGQIFGFEPPGVPVLELQRP